jgi:hypothetical protein
LAGAVPFLLGRQNQGNLDGAGKLARRLRWEDKPLLTRLENGATQNVTLVTQGVYPQRRQTGATPISTDTCAADSEGGEGYTVKMLLSQQVKRKTLPSRTSRAGTPVEPGPGQSAPDKGAGRWLGHAGWGGRGIVIVNDFR